jgi:predicted PurR-regulated permease PerM
MSNEQDTVGISKLFDAIQNVQGKVSEVKQTLNNGIVKRTKENTKAVNKLYNKVDDLKETIKADESYSKGKADMLSWVWTIIVGLGSGVVGTLTALSLLGLI